ncbi:MAG: DUF4179 domain-containing protein [Lachnospiraceae bacterium]|nr:DUF4179 domain-containing protein [Lachnospiraceae bacterium]MCD7842362.1 DUF4179 domain-containing protein [Lachnospiraceae bacterium]
MKEIKTEHWQTAECQNDSNKVIRKEWDPGEVIEILREDIEIPEVVKQKANEAFSKIHQEKEATANEAFSKTRQEVKTTAHSGSPEGETIYKKKGVRKHALTVGIAAACAVMICGVGAVAAYRQWSRSVEKGMQADEEQLANLEAEQMLSVSGTSVTDQGVTITSEEAIVDSHYAYLVFKVEGYILEEGAQPEFTNVDVSASDGEDLYLEGSGATSCNFYNGLIVGENGRAVNADGSEIKEDEDGNWLLQYVQEDGSLEYCITLYSTTEGAFIGRDLHIEFQGLGSYIEDSEEEIQTGIDGTWNFDLALSGSPNTTTFDLDAVLGDSGATVIQAVLSPLSATIYYEFPYSEYTVEAEDANGMTRITTTFDEAPAFLGFRMKDGTDIRYLTGGGSNGYDNDWNDIDNGEMLIYRVIQGYGRVIDVDEVESLLFLKSWPEESDEGEAVLTDEDLYIVSLQ